MEIMAHLQLLTIFALSYTDSANANQTNYYIYGINVTIPVYECTTECERNYESFIREKCEALGRTNKTAVEIKNVTSSCETSALVDLVYNFIKVSEKLRIYSFGSYHDQNYSHILVWNNDTCNNVDYKGKTTVSEIGKTKQYQIEYEGNNLFLKPYNRTFCGMTVWETYTHGLIISEEPIKRSLNSDSSSAAAKQKEKIEELQDLLYIIIAFFIISVLWYLFNTTVNFISLKRLGKGTGISSKAYLVNCLSQSLTNRYLYFRIRDSENYNLSSASDKRIPHEIYPVPGKSHLINIKT